MNIFKKKLGSDNINSIFGTGSNLLDDVFGLWAIDFLKGWKQIFTILSWWFKLLFASFILYAHLD